MSLTSYPRWGRKVTLDAKSLRRITENGTVGAFAASSLLWGRATTMNDKVPSSYIELTAGIVSAYVSNNAVAAGDISSLISQVHNALLRISNGQSEAPIDLVKPAIAVKKSITPEYIICLEDGKKFKSLKRHLRTQYDMTPEHYREKWGLPPDYPMVAPNYAEARSQLAKKMGLGQQRKRRSR
jgi:predicted transcriptional regulator